MNFQLNEVDLARFENAGIAFDFDGQDSNTKNGLGYTQRNMSFMGAPNNQLGRDNQ
jgi:hypothetical protein